MINSKTGESNPSKRCSYLPPDRIKHSCSHLDSHSKQALDYLRIVTDTEILSYSRQYSWDPGRSDTRGKVSEIDISIIVFVTGARNDSYSHLVPILIFPVDITGKIREPCIFI